LAEDKLGPALIVTALVSAVVSAVVATTVDCLKAPLTLVDEELKRLDEMRDISLNGAAMGVPGIAELRKASVVRRRFGTNLGRLNFPAEPVGWIRDDLTTFDVVTGELEDAIRDNLATRPIEARLISATDEIRLAIYTAAKAKWWWASFLRPMWRGD